MRLGSPSRECQRWAWWSDTTSDPSGDEPLPAVVGNSGNRFRAALLPVHGLGRGRLKCWRFGLPPLGQQPAQAPAAALACVRGPTTCKEEGRRRGALCLWRAEGHPYLNACQGLRCRQGSYPWPSRPSVVNPSCYGQPWPWGDVLVPQPSRTAGECQSRVRQTAPGRRNDGCPQGRWGARSQHSCHGRQPRQQVPCNSATSSRPWAGQAQVLVIRMVPGARSYTPIALLQ